MRFGWQNFTKEKSPSSEIPWHGRAWLRPNDPEGAPVFRLEWALGGRNLGARFAVTPHDDSTLAGHVALPLVALYWGIELPFKGRARTFLERLVGKTDINDRYGGREVTLSFHEATFYWHLWTDPGGWTNKRPFWRDGNFCLPDFVLGKAKYSHHVLRTEEILVPMPEKGYRGRCELAEDVWARPRWFARRLRRAHVEMTEPVPFPGKGENSWDQGDDACFGMTCPAATAEEAIAEIVKSVLTSRRRHGGRDWRPPEKAAA